MKKRNKYIFLGLILIFLCFVSVLIFTLPSFLNGLNLSETKTANIGNTIGGITAPILGMFSSLFLYITLTRQIEGNENQRLRNESDMIFLLQNQLENEYNTFYYSFKREERKENLKGAEAFSEFVYSFNSSNLSGSTLKDFFQARQIILLLRTFELVERRINSSNLNNDLRNVFKQKLGMFFDCRLSKELQIILLKCDKDNITDEYIVEIREFYNKQILWNTLL